MFRVYQQGSYGVKWFVVRADSLTPGSRESLVPVTTSICAIKSKALSSSLEKWEKTSHRVAKYPLSYLSFVMLWFLLLFPYNNN